MGEEYKTGRRSVCEKEVPLVYVEEGSDTTGTREKSEKGKNKTGEQHKKTNNKRLTQIAKQYQEKDLANLHRLYCAKARKKVKWREKHTRIECAIEKSMRG